MGERMTGKGQSESLYFSQYTVLPWSLSFLCVFFALTYRKKDLQLTSSFSAAHFSGWFFLLTSLTSNLKRKGLTDLFVFTFT